MDSIKYVVCMDANDPTEAPDDRAVTLPAVAQPAQSSEIATVAPRQTVVVIEQSVRPIERCGARIKDRLGESCAEAPVAGRRRCRLHGGLTPVGRQSPHFVHGRDSRYPVPLTEHEQTRYEQYMRAVFDQARHDLASDLAVARIQRDRAVAAGNAGVTEASAVARLAQVHAQITKGQTIRVVPDEAAITRFTDVVMAIVERRTDEAVAQGLSGAKTRELIARDMMGIDWSNLALPPAPRVGTSLPSESA